MSQWSTCAKVQLEALYTAACTAELEDNDLFNTCIHLARCSRPFLHYPGHFQLVSLGAARHNAGGGLGRLQKAPPGCDTWRNRRPGKGQIEQSKHEHDSNVKWQLARRQPQFCCQIFIKKVVWNVNSRISLLITNPFSWFIGVPNIEDSFFEMLEAAIISHGKNHSLKRALIASIKE